jgi:hypothetical protein
MRTSSPVQGVATSADDAMIETVARIIRDASTRFGHGSVATGHAMRRLKTELGAAMTIRDVFLIVRQLHNQTPPAWALSE